MVKRASEIISKKAKPLAKNPAKAGVMVYEDTPTGRKLLVSYNEGRFSTNGEYYVLPKGSVDQGESALHGGIRELGEETGFDLHSFLGAHNLAKLEAGKTLHNVTNRAYPGVMVVEFDPKGVAHEYHARTGSVQSMVMYGVKVKGIDKIGPLKNQQHATTQQLLNADRSIPRFPQMYSWLVQGKIPAETAEAEVQLCDPKWFAAKIVEYAPNGTIRQRGNMIETRDDWQAFSMALEADKAGIKILRECVDTIKTHLKKTGAVGGDKSTLKFDEKDCPLFWYVEGGHVGYAREILEETFKDIRANTDYARAFAGQGTNEKNLTAEEIMLHGQIAAYSAFVPVDDLKQAMDAAWGQIGASVLWLRDYGKACRQQQHAAHAR